MPINNITQTISTIPEAARRGVDVQTQFVIKQEDFQDHLQGITVTELNTLKDQLNSRIGEINSTTTTMNGYANTASAGASTATTKAGEASTSAGEALTYRNQAETFKNNATSSATKASQWADNNYNVEVETGKYSAKHWSTVAQNATANKIDKVASTDNAIVRFNGATGEVQNSSILIDDNGNLNITGIGKRITGDFSNSTLTDRVAFQTSILNDSTTVNASPNGTGVMSQFITSASSDASNASRCGINVSANNVAKVFSDRTGTGSFLPLTFYTGGIERMRIDNDGNVGIGTSSPAFNLDIINTSTTGTTADNTIIQLKSSNRNCGYLMDTIGGVHAGNISNYVSGVIKSQLKFDSTGNILSIFPNGGLGYGIGAGGTVTQLTNKNYNVSLNKPTGTIITSNSALVSGQVTWFTFLNSLLSVNDNLKLTPRGTLNYDIDVIDIYNGAAVIRIINKDSISHSDAISINFSIEKGAIS